MAAQHHWQQQPAGRCWRFCACSVHAEGSMQPAIDLPRITAAASRQQACALQPSPAAALPASATWHPHKQGLPAPARQL